MAEIKDVVIEDGRDVGDAMDVGNPSLPNGKSPGYAVGYPSCSEPTRTNKGCDAWNKCGTKGEGPYTVMFLNPNGRKTATHCRNWMYKLQFKQALGYRPIDDEWMECTESIAEDPLDIKKGSKLKTYKMKIDGVRLPYPDHTTKELSFGNTREEDQEKEREDTVGSDGNRKRRTRAKGTS